VWAISEPSGAMIALTRGAGDESWRGELDRTDQGHGQMVQGPPSWPSISK